MLSVSNATEQFKGCLMDLPKLHTFRVEYNFFKELQLIHFSNLKVLIFNLVWDLRFNSAPDAAFDQLMAQHFNTTFAKLEFLQVQNIVFDFMKLPHPNLKEVNIKMGIGLQKLFDDILEVPKNKRKGFKIKSKFFVKYHDDADRGIHQLQKKFAKECPNAELSYKIKR
ncbi:hypothetical protein FGO68_gene4188 [Halteria grandinella]|uniref:Uncharacterized protein n=1 Tax=Halteria grandinella TaxID=5974 RepID=A0A8J8NSR8_HALGN|nr:hypothetical protein FGO68_gene4188 [Halteria grandinella]